MFIPLFIPSIQDGSRAMGQAGFCWLAGCCERTLTVLPFCCDSLPQARLWSFYPLFSIFHLALRWRVTKEEHIVLKLVLFILTCSAEVEYSSLFHRLFILLGLEPAWFWSRAAPLPQHHLPPPTVNFGIVVSVKQHLERA